MIPFTMFTAEMQRAQRNDDFKSIQLENNHILYESIVLYDLKPDNSGRTL